MKSQTIRLREAGEKFNHTCREFAESIGVTPEPCTTRKPTPAEALELKINLPWRGKVQVITPDELTPDLFDKLEKYGVFRADITELFGFKNAPAFYTWLRNNNVPISGRCGARIKPLRSHDVVVTKRNGKAALEPKELAERATEIMQEKLDIAIAGEGPIPGPVDVVPAVAQAVAQAMAEATREQVEEFFADAEPATGGVVSAETNAEILEKLQQQGPPPIVMPHPVTVNEFRDGGRQCGKTIMMSNPGRPEWPYPWPPAPGELEAWDKTLSGACAADPVTDAPQSGLATDQHHYNAAGDFQPIEVMQASMPQQQFIGFLRGNVIKYTMRAGRKDDMRREIDKVIQYATWWRAAVDGKTIDPRDGAK